ncbi:MAG: Ca-activated chloride channel family protein [Desulforhopalus sp.]|jgi:Ca-activated chloride channel family protein
MYRLHPRQTLSILLSTMFIMQGCSPTKQTTEEVETLKSPQIEVDVVKEEKQKRQSSIPQMIPGATMDIASTNIVERERFSAPQKLLNYGATPRSIMAQESYYPQQRYYSQESYSAVNENSFISTFNDSLSTFSIDVDTGSYANIRRMLIAGHKVPVGAVRIEEMLNYFSYNYPEPTATPIGITTEVGPCPWQPEHKIARIGIKGKEIETNLLPPSNLVFLIDVSGSMNQAQKLPLVKKSLQMLAKQLTDKDRISIVVYAGNNRIVLPPTAGDQKDIIYQAIGQLNSGGATHGSAGILSAYKLAHQNFFPGGNNRIILASDGDFNVGVTSRGELTKLIETEREKGVFLTVLGFGNGNYKDDTMEMLADKGNGNYSYIDSLLEAKKVLVKERSSTLFTLARDVKLQIEFNPAKVGAYRLLGYENRLLADEDFTNDKKDAGEIGVGHTVTALYELIPLGSPNLPSVPDRKYQRTLPVENQDDELLTVSLRYQEPQGSASRQISQTLVESNTDFASTSDDFRFATSVAWFGMLLQKSEFVTTADYPKLIKTAKLSRGKDNEGLRAELVKLVEMAQLLTN